MREMLPKYRNEFVRMGVPNIRGELTLDEVDVAQMYCVLVMCKEPSEEDAYYQEDEEDRKPKGKNQKQISVNDIVFC